MTIMTDQANPLPHRKNVTKPVWFPNQIQNPFNFGFSLVQHMVNVGVGPVLLVRIQRIKRYRLLGIIKYGIQSIAAVVVQPEVQMLL